MPIPWLGAAIAGGAGLLSGGINAASQANLNKSTQRYNNWMYDKQRGDALFDYNMQNEYNSPTSQMERLRKAGLNPNLVYNNGATTTAAPVRSTEAKTWNPQAPQFDFKSVADSIMSYVDMRMKEQQIDNLKTQNTVLATENELKKAQVDSTRAGTASTITGTEKTKFDLEQAKNLAPGSLQMQQLNLDKTKGEINKIAADILYTLDNNQRAELLNASTVREATQRILTSMLQNTKIPIEKMQIQQAIENMKTDNLLKQSDLRLKDQGVQPTDNIIFRQAVQMVHHLLNPSSSKGPGKEGSKMLGDIFGKQLFHNYKNKNR